ncbi:MAG: TolC family protein, partial [Balneolales bacterium]|nr:TolC family protein [Balneolales bacterium]
MGLAIAVPQTVHAQATSEQVLINMNPMSLDDAIKLGLERNFGIQLAKNEAEIARLNRNFGAAGMTPDLDVTAGISGGREDLVETIDGAEGPSVRTTNQVSNIDAALNWTIFDGFRMFTTYERLGELERLGEVRARVEIESSV